MKRNREDSSDAMEEIFNPILKEKRLAKEIISTTKKFNRLVADKYAMKESLSMFKKKLPHTNILLNTPAEIILSIMRYSNFEDVMAMITAVPELDAIYRKHNMSKYFFEKAYGWRKIEGITDFEGFMRSECIQWFNESGTQRFQLPAGEYIIGPLKSTLAKEVYDDLWLKKPYWKNHSGGGLYDVKAYRKKNGTFAVVQFESNVLQDTDGHQYRAQSFNSYFGCIPLSLVKGSKTDPKRKKIKSSRDFSATFRGDEFQNYLELAWTEETNGEQTRKSLKLHDPSARSDRSDRSDDD